MLERGAHSNWAKTPGHLKMGENLGTIDASAYLIVPRGITRCPNASASSGSTPKTGRPFNNIRVFPEQTAYELLRPVVLFGDPAIQRAQETDEPRTSLERKADTFDEQGMVSLFASRPRKQPRETARSLPPDMRQLIVDLRVEMPNMSIREIAEICDTRFHRRPSHHSIHLSRCAASLSLLTPLIRRNAVTTLCSFMLSGWSVASIAEYLGVSKQTVYTTLKRWWQEGVKGLDDKSHARHPRQERSHLKSPMRSAKSKRIRSSANGACTPCYSRRE
jgi:predicted DNA-binding protein YlxM (UPF0122 family)